LASLLWIIAAAIVLWGVVSLMTGASAVGVALIIGALVVASAGSRVSHT
jgi:hypothetical protein